jgi:hypothetical protein
LKKRIKLQKNNKKKEASEFNQMRLMFGHLVLVLMKMDVVEEIVENKDKDVEVILLAQQVEEYLLIL